jgi:diguanylate cyclase (GGDEF)-like protein
MTNAISSSRRLIYIMLLLVVAASVTLSVVMEKTAHNIRRNETPLLTKTIPQLRYLGDFESAMLRYQLAFDKRFTASITSERFHVLENMGRGELDASLAQLRSSLGDGPELGALREGYLDIVKLAPDFERGIDADPAAARRVLIAMNNDVKRLRAQIDGMQQQVQDAINDKGSMASRSVAGITLLVHLFDVLALLTCLFMLHHVRARVRIEDELKHQAGHDPLTGLAHRRTFEARLAALPAQQAHVVVLGTIDRFSRIVGGFGHAFGDRVMVGLTGRIRAAAERCGGEVFRLDGANFAILYGMDCGSGEFRAAMDGLREEACSPFDCEGHEIFTTLSLGAVTYPHNGATPDVLLRNADAALQAARKPAATGWWPIRSSSTPKRASGWTWNRCCATPSSARNWNCIISRSKPCTTAA